MNDLISIIVPIYNSERYLDECLKSIQCQTYKNLEIILINDGSEDDSFKICEKYISIDKRFIVINNLKNSGSIGLVRNIGLNSAKGSYIAFVDSDDKIAADMYEILISEIRKNEADIAICMETRVADELLKPVNKYETEILNAKHSINDMLKGIKFNTELWNKLFKRELFDYIQFSPNLIIGEDLQVVYKLFHKADKVIYIPLKKYYYRVHDTNITKKINYNRVNDVLNVYCELSEFLEQHYPSLLKILYIRRTMYEAQSIMSLSEKSGDDIIVLKKRLIYDIRNNMTLFMKSDYKLIDKLFVLVCSVSPSFALRLYQFIKKK